MFVFILRFVSGTTTQHNKTIATRVTINLACIVSAVVQGDHRYLISWPLLSLLQPTARLPAHSRYLPALAPASE